MEILQINDLSFQYPDEATAVLNNINLNVQSGQFIVIGGASGSGKSTLLRLIKHELAPFGKRTGDIFYKRKEVATLDEHTLASEIGMVFQDPNNQIVLDEVLQEITFGMENLNIPLVEMRKRLSELVHFFGIEGLLHEKTNNLSGGQKQLVNLLSVLLLRPQILLLDEPTSQLDPVSAKDLLHMLERINHEMGMTIILAEHRLEELFAIADKVVLLDEGKMIYNDSSREVINKIFAQADKRFIHYLPSVSRLYLEKEPEIQTSAIPLNVKECRQWLQQKKGKLAHASSIVSDANIHAKQPLLNVDTAYFQYERDLHFVLQNCSLTVYEGEFFALVGSNGVGKSTLLNVCMGVLTPQRGKITFKSKRLKLYKQQELVSHFAYLPQHPLAFYIEETIGEEMDAIIKKYRIENGTEKKIAISERLNIAHLLHRHPNDLSGGELQRATIACLLLEKPTILFIDEPTKGLDPIAKQTLAAIITNLQKEGVTIFMVTHDIEFAVKYVDRCAILFNGEITAEGTPKEIFHGNYFYTTTINRATQKALTLEEALHTCEITKAT